MSIKIIWMVHNQTRVEHFQFWMLNAIEFRINELARDLRNIEKSPVASHREKGRFTTESRRRDGKAEVRSHARLAVCRCGAGIDF